MDIKGIDSYSTIELEGLSIYKFGIVGPGLYCVSKVVDSWLFHYQGHRAWQTDLNRWNTKANKILVRLVHWAVLQTAIQWKTNQSTAVWMHVWMPNSFLMLFVILAARNLMFSDLPVRTLLLFQFTFRVNKAKINSKKDINSVYMFPGKVYWCYASLPFMASNVPH